MMSANNPNNSKSTRIPLAAMALSAVLLTVGCSDPETMKHLGENANVFTHNASGTTWIIQHRQGRQFSIKQCIGCEPARKASGDCE